MAIRYFQATVDNPLAGKVLAVNDTEPVFTRLAAHTAGYLNARQRAAQERTGITQPARMAQWTEITQAEYTAALP